MYVFDGTSDQMGQSWANGFNSSFFPFPAQFLQSRLQNDRARVAECRPWADEFHEVAERTPRTRSNMIVSPCEENRCETLFGTSVHARLRRLRILAILIWLLCDLCHVVSRIFITHSLCLRARFICWRVLLIECLSVEMN